MPSELVTRVAAFCAQHELLPRDARVLVGVSGGADSLVLLHVLVALRDSGAWDHALTLHAAVLDHGIRGAASAEDADVVRATAARWDVPVTVERANVPQIAREQGLGIEDAARQARYAFLTRVAQASGMERVAVGHHRDDQAETVLLHLIRGSGIDGLRGMLPLATVPASPDAPESSVPALPLIRPLLAVSRADIDAYAAANDLHPREDATNRDPAYARNYLRHTIIPQLETLNPNLRATLARTAALLRADADRLHDAGTAAFDAVRRARLPDAIVLDRARWAALHLADQRRVIRAAARELRPGLRDLALVHVESAIEVARTGATGAQTTLPEGLRWQVDEDVIVLADAAAVAAALVAHIDAPALAPADALHFRAGEDVARRFGGWTFAARMQPVDTLSADDLHALHADPLAAALRCEPGAAAQLRVRQAGDRFLPRGMQGRGQPLVTTLSGMGVPQTWRERVPLLWLDGDLAWFVAPSARGLRGRIGSVFAVPEGLRGVAQVLIVRWQQQ